MKTAEAINTATAAAPTAVPLVTSGPLVAVAGTGDGVDRLERTCCVGCCHSLLRTAGADVGGGVGVGWPGTDATNGPSSAAMYSADRARSRGFFDSARVTMASSPAGTSANRDSGRGGVCR